MLLQVMQHLSPQPLHCPISGLLVDMSALIKRSFRLLGLKCVCYDGVISSPQIRYSIKMSCNNCFAFTNFFSIPISVSLKLEAAFENMNNDLSRHAEDNKVMYLSFANIENI
jgi:hypothetical protein